MPDKTIKTTVAVLGGGPAGYVAAIRAAQLGAKVVLIEKAKLGGVCLNRGCIPTKAMLHSGQVASLYGRAKEFGIEAETGRTNFGKIVERKNRVVKSLYTGLSSLIAAKGIDVVQGNGVVQSPTEILVQTNEGDRTVQCDQLILATGSRPAMPPIAGLNAEGVLTSTEALDLDTLPGSIAILGAGVIGVEFASIFSALGSQVTVLEMEDGCLPGMDRALADGIFKNLRRQKVAFKLGVTVNKVETLTGGLIVSYGNGQSLKCDKLLVATGRKGNLDAFEVLGIKISDGHVLVNEKMETSVPGVYAAGDVIGGPLLAHLAFAEGRTAADNALGADKTMDYLAVPSCIYTSPEIAVVGLSEDEAVSKGIQPLTGRFDMRGNGRAQTLAERDGFVKVIADENGTIVGGQILATNASELISEFTLAIACKAKLETLADLIHPHPTLSEAVWEACCNALGMGIHSI